MKNLKAVVLVSMLILSTSIMFAAEKTDVKPVGTWTFVADDAPYEYSTGDIVITKDGKEYKGEIVFSEYYKLKTTDFKIEDNKISFKAYVEGEVVYCKGTFVDKDKIEGKVSTSEGTMDFSATRKKK
ncbi:MAG: hypothetical protein J7L04_06180 [Bacteroidales bacterium]|nr:hypothetical protein [Bacteroidales bacterium]